MGKRILFSTPSASASGVAIQSTIVNISSAQILALFSSPVALLPAPGAGKIYRVIAFQWNFLPGSTAYTTTGALTLQLADSALATTLVPITIPNSGLGNAAATGNSLAGGAGGMTLTPTSKLINKALVLWLSGANPTLGNGTAIVTIEYYIVSLS